MAEVPLHRLFKRTQNPAATIADVLKEVGGDFTVEKEDHYIMKMLHIPFFPPIPLLKKVPGTSAIVKQEGWEPLSVMGDRYGIIQFQTALDFLDDMIGNREVEIWCAAVLDGGTKLHLIVKAPDFVELSPGERFECFFTVSASHDGTGCLQAMCSPIHNVSQTVFTPRKGRGVVKIKHTKNAKDKVALGRRMFNKLYDSWKGFGDNFEEMTNMTLTEQQAKDYFHAVIGGDSTRANNIKDHVWDIYKSAGLCRHLPSCKDTLFGCFMAIQQQADYYKTVRKAIRRNETDAKIEARLTGDGAKLKALAYSEALLLLQKFGKKVAK